MPRISRGKGWGSLLFPIELDSGPMDPTVRIEKPKRALKSEELDPLVGAFLLVLVLGGAWAVIGLHWLGVW